jgi:hypothetical protein
MLLVMTELKMLGMMTLVLVVLVGGKTFLSLSLGLSRGRQRRMTLFMMVVVGGAR